MNQVQEMIVYKVINQDWDIVIQTIVTQFEVWNLSITDSMNRNQASQKCLRLDLFCSGSSQHLTSTLICQPTTFP